MADVRLPRSLTALFPDAPRRESVEGSSVREVIDRLDERWPGMRDRLCQPGPVLREHINVFVDGDRATLSTEVTPRSEVWILPAVSGG